MLVRLKLEPDLHQPTYHWLPAYPPPWGLQEKEQDVDIDIRYKGYWNCRSDWSTEGRGVSVSDILGDIYALFIILVSNAPVYNLFCLHHTLSTEPPCNNLGLQSSKEQGCWRSCLVGLKFALSVEWACAWSHIGTR